MGKMEVKTGKNNDLSPHTMNNTVKNPLVIRCEYCGGDLGYDIVKQRYCCAHCGAESGTAEKKAEYRHWKSLRKEIVMQDIAKIKSFSCPTCGAQTITEGENATAICPFCQNTMIDAKFAGNDLPEVILPFKLSKEEAEAKLRTWLNNNKKDRAARIIEQNMQHFTGCFLPYHIVRGAIDSNLQIRLHDGSVSSYPFRAYLSHTAVNASKDLNNLFLDGIEPFDFDAALEFNFGQLNHQNAKVQNVSNKILEQRINEETQNELYGSLNKKAHTKEMSIRLDDKDGQRAESIPALMPVYLVKCKDGVTAAVNGQTGKVSIDTGKKKNRTRFWWIAPSIATLIIGFIGSYFGGLELGFVGALVFGIVFFAVAHNRHSDELVQKIYTYPKEQETHNDTQAEFFTDFGNGLVPAKLRFFTPWRLTKSVLVILAVIFLPVLIAIPIQLLRGLPLSDIHIGYGAAWYCIPGFMTIVAAGGIGKSMMNGAPIFTEILSAEEAKRRKPRTKKRSLLTGMISACKELLHSKEGRWVAVFMLFLLFGSTLAMIY